jgi:hypothetical protein
LADVLTSPAVIEQLREKLVPPTPTPVAIPVQPKLEGIKKGCRKVFGWIGSGLMTVANVCLKGLKTIGRFGKAVLSMTGTVVKVGRQRITHWFELATVFVVLAFKMARRFRIPLLTALVIGLTLGLLAFVAGRMVAAILTGMGSFVVALSIQVGLWFRRMLNFGPWAGSDVPMASVG